MERQIAIGGVENLRDLGGYRTADGRHVTVNRRLFRSDTLARIASDEVAQSRLFNELNIGYAIDFRVDTELIQNPYKFDQLEYVNIPVGFKEIFQPMAEAKEITVEMCTSCMVELYKHFVLKFTREFGDYLRLLLAHRNADKAVLIHCTAGKDRTGYASFLFLALMGVPMDVIFDDYLLTNKLLRSLMPMVDPGSELAWTKNEAVYDAMHSVKSEYLQASLDTILSRYKDVPDYVMSTMDISQEDIEALKKSYLVPA